VHPTAGVVLLEGMPVRAQSHSSMARRRAVLPQQHVVGFSFTAEAVVRMGRAPWGRTARADEDDDTVRAAMETCDVAHLGHRPFGALSGGEKARVALARVLAQSTQTLLLDEPTAALDVRHQEEVMRIATDRAAAGDAVVVVMHDLGLASAFGDRVAVMDSGQVRATGTPLEVLREDLLSEVYRYPIEVSTHAGAQLITPRRARRS
jgi:iron complex transport system ATP-binding protein